MSTTYGIATATASPFALAQQWTSTLRTTNDTLDENHNYDNSMVFLLKTVGSPHMRELHINTYKIKCGAVGNVDWVHAITIPRDELESKKNFLNAIACPKCNEDLYLVRGFCFEMGLTEIMKLECKRRIRQDEGNGDSRALTILGDFISAFKDEKKEEKERDERGDGKDVMQ